MSRIERTPVGTEGKEGKTGPEGPAGAPKTAKEPPLEISGSEITVKAKGITDAMLAEIYALLAGRAGGQELIGGTNEADKLILKSDSASVHPAIIVLEGALAQKAVIKKGSELGVLEVAQILGLIRRRFSARMMRGARSTVVGLATAGYLSFGGEAPAEYVANQTTVEYKAAFVHLTSNKAVLFGGLAVVGNIYWLYNAGAFNITIVAETMKQVCKTTELSKNVKVTSTAELMVAMGVAGTGIKAGTTISTVVPPEEITISNAVKAGEGGEPELTFTSPAAASKRGKWSTGKGLVIEPGHTKLVFYDSTTLKWHDITDPPPTLLKALTVEELLTASGGLTVAGTLTLPSESVTEAMLGKATKGSKALAFFAGC